MEKLFAEVLVDDAFKIMDCNGVVANIQVDTTSTITDAFHSCVKTKPNLTNTKNTEFSLSINFQLNITQLNFEKSDNDYWCFQPIPPTTHHPL